MLSQSPSLPLPGKPTAVAARITAAALQSAIFNSANFSSIATDINGVIQIFNVGAERMLGYTALEVINKVTPAEISDPQEVIERAKTLTVELGTPIAPGFEALVFKAARGIEDIYELTYLCKDGSRFPAVVSVTALRDAQDAIIGYLLIGTDNTERKQTEKALAQYRANLEQLVESRTAELTASLLESTRSYALLQREMEEHQRAEDHLLRSELMLTQATHLAQLGAWSMALLDLENFDLNPVAWSLEMFRLLDYQPQDLSVLSSALLFARIHPQDRQRFNDMTRQAITEKRSWQIEFRLVWADGSEHLVVQTGSFIFNDSGRPISMHGAVKDITAQRQLENQLRESEARLQMALKGAQAGSFEWNTETGDSYWSAEVWVLSGLEPQEGPPSYETWRQTVHSEDLARLERITEAALSQRAKFEVEWQVKLPPGVAPRWLMSRAQPMPEVDGRVVCYRGIIMDITQSRQAEFTLELYRDHLEERVAERTAELVGAEAEQLRLNRALRLLSDCNMAVVHATSERQLLDDLCRLVVETGGYLMAWVGVAELDAAKMVRPVASFGDPTGYLDRMQVSWDDAQATGRGPTGSAVRTGLTQVIQNCWVNPLMAPWRQAAIDRGYQSSVGLPLVVAQQTLGVLTLYSLDANAFGEEEVKLLQELANEMAFGLQSLRVRSQLERYQLQLEKLVSQRTHEIEALNTQLLAKARDAEAANLAKGTFLATMSHELRTPLNAVVGLTGLLADSPLNRRQRDYADKVQLSAQTLRALIDDILDFSKIEAGELQLEQAPFSLNAILRTTAAAVGVGLRDKPVEALFDVASNVPDAVMGDSLRLQQILLNLTSNAVKFTEAGEIVVSVRCLAHGVGGVTLQFAVHDTGIGIAPELLGPIFDRFTQANHSTSRLYGGSGLGLSISARLITLMDGHIYVDSTLGQGSEFRFFVTLALNCDALPVARTDGLSTLNILIVDDHPLARAVLTQACTAFGWQATAVDSGAAALMALRRSAAENCDYDLMLLDWRMPGMDGLEMLRQAYAAPDFGLPLVVLMATIFELEQVVAASDDLALDGIVAKPMTPTSLLDAVTRAFSGEHSDLLLPVSQKDRRLSGMRLLVAEDNALNQEVIEQILTRAGAQVVLVMDGLAAVTALRFPGAHFDAVLMDIQMPVMDGYTATRMIREELGLLELPIIAVTAFAQSVDREKSRLAGMVGHIVKPLDVEVLLDLLAHERQHAQTRAMASADPAPQRSTPALALAGLDVAAALKAFGGDEKSYRVILRKFLLQQGGDVDEAQRLFTADDAEGAIRLLHDLGGVAGLLQATELARQAMAAEAALRAGNVMVMPVLFAELHAAMCTLQESIQRFEERYVDI